MKKIILLIVFAVTTSAYSQKSTEDYKFFEEPTQNDGTEDAGDDFPGTPGGEQAPIDNYIPALAVVGLGMAIYFGRKKMTFSK